MQYKMSNKCELLSTVALFIIQGQNKRETKPNRLEGYSKWFVIGACDVTRRATSYYNKARIPMHSIGIIPSYSIFSFLR